MFTENNSTAQAVIQIASPLAMILTLLVAISSASLGAFVSWWANSRAMRRAKDELSQVRTVRQSALTVRQQALQERERAARELQSRTRENEKTQSEVQILRHQLSQAQTALRASESQRIEHITTITALNAQLKEYRARASESHNVVASLQATFTELSHHLQQQNVRMTETGLRTNGAPLQLPASTGTPQRTQSLSPTAAEQPHAQFQTSSENVADLENQLLAMLEELKR